MPTYRSEGGRKKDKCDDGDDTHDDGFLVRHVRQVQGGLCSLPLEMLKNLSCR